MSQAEMDDERCRAQQQSNEYGEDAESYMDDDNEFRGPVSPTQDSMFILLFVSLLVSVWPAWFAVGALSGTV